MNLSAILFGEPLKTKYAGFKFVRLMICIYIYLILFAAIIGFTLVVGGVLIAVINQGLNGLIALLPAGLLFLYGAIYTIVTLGIMVFVRNLIEWLVDMETHARAIRGNK